MATGPKPPRSALELLSDEREREIPFLSKFWGPTVGGVLGFVGAIVGNNASKRPVMSGIQRHLLYAAIGIWFGKWAEDYRLGYLAEKDAVLKHYVQLHPDDFPPYERKKYAEVLEPWIPIR